MDHLILIPQMEKLLVLQGNDQNNTLLTRNTHRNIHHRQDPQKKLKTRLPQTNQKSNECHFRPQ